MRVPIHLAALAAAVALAACGKAETGERYHGDQATPPASPSVIRADAAGAGAATGESAPAGADGADAGDATRPPAATADSAAPQMVIRSGTASIEVDQLGPAVAKVTRLAAELGGYVASTAEQSGADNVRQATLELKVPAARWPQLESGLDPVGKLESRQTTSDDVGEEYVDVDARMQNARRLEDRLQNLLATRTGKLDDVLAVERELARVREEIERFEGRLRYLRAHAAMSTLTVTLHEPPPVIGPGGNPIVGAFARAWRNFVAFTAGLIAVSGWLVPLLGIIGALVWLLRRLRGRGRARPEPGSATARRGGTPPPAGPAAAAGSDGAAAAPREPADAGSPSAADV